MSVMELVQTTTSGVLRKLVYGRVSLLDLEQQMICRDDQDTWHVSQTQERVLLVIRQRRGRSASMAVHPVELENLWALLDHYVRQRPQRYKVVRAELDNERTRKVRMS